MLVLQLISEHFVPPFLTDLKPFSLRFSQVRQLNLCTLRRAEPGLIQQAYSELASRGGGPSRLRFRGSPR